MRKKNRTRKKNPTRRKRNPTRKKINSTRKKKPFKKTKKPPKKTTAPTDRFGGPEVPRHAPAKPRPVRLVGEGAVHHPQHGAAVHGDPHHGCHVLHQVFCGGNGALKCYHFFTC